MKTFSALGIALLISTASAANLDSVKTYLGGEVADQIKGTQGLLKAANAYYAKAKAAQFDYKKLASDKSLSKILNDARKAWELASPAYENVEGIVAGVEQLSEFDVILDAGTSAADGGEDVVPFDLKLPNGKVLPKPGNLFGVTEGSLWGTEKAFRSNVKYDIDGDGITGFGDWLPDANVLKAAAQDLNTESLRLQKAANAWKPTRSDVFGALVGNVPTVGPVFFEDWKSSPFVIGNKSTRRDFVVISRMSDLRGNVASWQAMYKGLSPDIKTKNSVLDSQITAGLNELARFVDRLVAREKERRYTPEQAEQLQKEAQNKATAITGKITQAAALLGVSVE